MSAPGKTSQDTRKSKSRKPPPRWRRYLVQAELELPPPTLQATAGAGAPGADDPSEWDQDLLPWYQKRVAVFALGATCLALIVVTGMALWNGARDREAAKAAEARARTLTLRAVNSERALRITPNPRSWSATADASIAWPEPPQLLELSFPIGYARYAAYALVVDKVDHGRVMVIERMTADSNRDLRVAVNSSAFGPGEYRIRVQGYTWRGQRIDVGWVRLVVR
jgi:hypothetical protein